ncbi:hypothetical protein B0J18DRAFT_484735 [Chaetomium sp. MPI-SDFR-AT-0129]|nr:hypothetical protein B0J18DRAFT_484735 [Chaetomium sp. MPI-SDFR-AT-0129]
MPYRKLDERRARKAARAAQARPSLPSNTTPGGGVAAGAQLAGMELRTRPLPTRLRPGTAPTHNLQYSPTSPLTSSLSHPSPPSYPVPHIFLSLHLYVPPQHLWTNLKSAYILATNRSFLSSIPDICARLGGRGYSQNTELESDSFDMSLVSEALGAAMVTSSEKNLRDLLRAVDFNVLKLANVALRINNSPESVAFLLGTALMMADEKAAEAGATAERAEGAADAARQEANTAQANFDELRQALHQQTQAMVIQTRHIAELKHRVKELEKQVDTSSSLLIMHLEGTLTNQEIVRFLLELKEPSAEASDTVEL